jgi:uncharacterized protein (DUF305 family)
MTIKYLLSGLAIGLVVGAGAYAQHAGHPGGMMGSGRMQKMMDDMMPKDSDSAATKAFKEAHMKMMHNMHITYSGNADVDFLRGMIPHHQGAIDMAKVLLAHGANPQIKAMAQKIIDDQTREIGKMETWLKANAK